MLVDNLGKTPGWSLYVHIPFCEYRCRYCDFYFETTRSRSLQTRLVDALLKELKTLADGKDGYFQVAEFRTLYLGGGTPSALAPDLLDRLLQGIKEIVGVPSWEGSIEANPEGITPEFLHILEKGGITRLSVGVQSLKDEVLHTLGRRAYRTRTLEALELIRITWKGRFSLDIMTGLPGQTWDDLKGDMDTLLAFNPDHVSLYSLTMEAGTPLEELVKKRAVTLPPPGLADELWLKAKAELEIRGYRWYEISNFALPGGESRHNQVYWRLDPYAGIGPGAQGTLWDDSVGGPVRTSNPKLFDYLSGVPAEKEVLSDRSFFLEHLITGLRTSEGVSWARLQTRFGIDLRTDWKGLWPDLQEKGWMEDSVLLSDFFVLTLRGRLLLDRVLEYLLPWSRRLAFPENHTLRF